MEHTEKYLQAKWVTENPNGYDERDVIDAKRYCNAYLDGYNQALRIQDVSGELADFVRFLSDEYSIEIHERILDEWEKYYSANDRQH